MFAAFIRAFVNRHATANKKNMKRDFVKWVSTCIVRNDTRLFKQFLEASLLTYFDDVDDTFVMLMAPLFIHFKPDLSFILKISHAFCEDCCNLYTPCNIDKWKTVNSELFESEIPFFKKIYESFKSDINIDVDKYDLNSIRYSLNIQENVSSQSDDEKLKQIFTVMLQ